MAVVLATDEPGMITGHVYQRTVGINISTALALSVPAKQTTGWFTRRSQMSGGMPNETDLSAERQRRNLAHGYTAWSMAERRRSIEPTAAERGDRRIGIDHTSKFGGAQIVGACDMRLWPAARLSRHSLRGRLIDGMPSGRNVLLLPLLWYGRRSGAARFSAPACDRQRSRIIGTSRSSGPRRGRRNQVRIFGA